MATPAELCKLIMYLMRTRAKWKLVANFDGKSLIWKLEHAAFMTCPVVEEVQAWIKKRKQMREDTDANCRSSSLQDSGEMPPAS